MNDKTSNKLLPCPFCSGEEISMGAYSISPDCYIECKSCGCMIEKEVPWNGMNQEEHDRECAKFLIEAWNTRKPMERIVERLEEELALSDKEKLRCINEDALQFDIAKGYATGIYNAIEIVKEEIEISGGRG